MRIHIVYDPTVVHGIFVYGGGGDSYVSNCVPKLYIPSTVNTWGRWTSFLVPKAMKSSYIFKPF